MTPDQLTALTNRMIGETEIALEKAGDNPLTESAIRTLALVLIADRLCVLAGHARGAEESLGYLASAVKDERIHTHNHGK